MRIRHLCCLFLVLLFAHPAFAEPLDLANNVGAAFSLRKLRASYTGSAIMVRRSSDNTTRAIGFDSNGDLDTATLMSFVGTGNGFVTIWYDQSGNNRNLIQNTTTAQPYIVRSGVLVTQSGRPAVRVISGTNLVTNPASWLVTGDADRALNAILTRFSDALDVVAVWSGSHTTNRAFGIDNGRRMLFVPYVYSTGDVTTTTVPAGVTKILTAIRRSGVSYGYSNGTLFGQSSVTIATTATNGFGIGRRPDGAQTDGWYHEFVYFTSAITDYGRKFLEQNQAAYYGLPYDASSTAIQLSLNYNSSVTGNALETANFKAIPGAVIDLTLTAANQQDSPDSNTIVIEQAINPALELFVGNYSGGAPFSFVNGSPTCGISITFQTLASTADDVEFLDANGNLVTPAPDADQYDSAIRKVRFRPKGKLNSNWGSPPTCSIRLRARVK